nr:unnamed protein product [Spirometra erinaceieuropaei]
MAEIADGDWIYPIPRSAFSLYPQALDIKQVPIFNQTIRFLSVSSTVCAPGKAAERSLDAIVAIKSAAYNFADRDRLRRAFAEETQREPEFRMAVVFSVGLPRSSGGRFLQRDGFNISLPDRAGEAMEKMKTKRSEVLRNLTEEARVNGDILLGDYEDTYFNLTLKLFHTFQWASHFCRTHFTSQTRPTVFIQLDDDFAFNASLLKAELDALTDEQIRRVTWNLPRNHSRVVRHLDSWAYEKWSVSKRELKTVLRAVEDPGNWSDNLPLTLLGIRAALKSDLGCSAAELVFGTTLRLPGEMITPTSRGADETPDNLVLRLRQFMRSLSPVPSQAPMTEPYVEKDLNKCTYVSVRSDRERQPLESLYEGPFSVLARHTKTFRILRSDKEDVVKAAVAEEPPDRSQGQKCADPTTAVPPSSLSSTHSPCPPPCPFPPLPFTPPHTSSPYISTAFNCNTIIHHSMQSTLFDYLCMSSGAVSRRPPV